MPGRPGQVEELTEGSREQANAQNQPKARGTCQDSESVDGYLLKAKVTRHSKNTEPGRPV